MTSSRFDIGLAKLEEIEGNLGRRLKEQLDQLSPDLAALVIELFGDV